MESITPDQSGPADVRSSHSAPSWPDRYDETLARLLIDNHMIAHYDDQSGAVVSAFQWKHLAKLLTHAHKHSVWWRDWLQPALAGATVRFERLPLMAREHYRAALKAADGSLPLPPGHGVVQENATSGSSGIPLKFYHSGRAAAMNAAHYRYDRVRQRINSQRLFARLAPKMDAHLGPHVHIPGMPLIGQSEEVRRHSTRFTVEEHARWFADIGASYLVGHTGVLSGILDAYEQGSVAVPVQPVAALLSYAETVTPEFRSQARRVLGARVLDRYSCEEVGPLAFQCPVSDEHYHIASTNALVEVLDETGQRSVPGELGRVFVTGLHNYASPVVRYELGDLAAWAPRCVCGYNKPVLSRLLGRTRFLVRLPSGERQYVRITAGNWLSVAPVKEARVVQVSEGVIHAECVLDRALTPAERDAVERMLKREIGAGLIYKVMELDKIDWGPTYKRQDVVSLV